MKCLTTAVLLAASSLPLAATADITPQQLEAAAKAVDAKVITWRRDLHEHPELGNRETRTAAMVADHLRKLGFEVKTGIAKTGVAAILRGGKPGPTIALRADMDALPVTEQVDLPFRSRVTTDYNGQKVGVMHACGHDVHTSVLMGAAEALAGMKKDLPGTILFIFQPAEEGPPAGERGGAPLMLDEGLFDLAPPDAAFGLHVMSGLKTGEVGYRSGPFMAGSDFFKIVVTGKQTHGAKPWGGIDPIVVASQIVMGLQTIVSRQTDIAALPAIITVGSIRGGIRHNIIPDTVEMLGTIRNFDPAVREDILMRVRRTAESIAAASGATAKVELDMEPNPVTYNNPALTERVLPSLRRASPKVGVRSIPLVTGSEDFSFYGKRVPSVFWFVGVTPPDQNMATVAANHSPLFYVDEGSVPVALRSILTVAVDYLQGGAAKP
ncbi:MAG: amidohydrolase [Steroidobacteraceae bacterium]|nr:amidohydrolase [Steroidobacteraceae bacterium]